MLDKGHLLDGKYKVIDILGKGGMSVVYLCENIRLQQLWAIKEVPGDLKYEVDFLTEPNILKRLSHPGIPRIIDIFSEKDNLYIVEDYIKGRTLEDIVKNDGSLDIDRICEIAMDICDILEYLHSFDPPIIYRDLKPSNIMITNEGRVMLVDFGISRVYKSEKKQDTVFMGSMGYAAPEQFGSMQSGKQTDIYGLGATMYYMFFKRPPKSITEPLKDETYEGFANKEIKDIIQKSMEIDMEKRYEGALELKSAIKSALIRISSTRLLNEMNLEDNKEGSDTKSFNPREGHFYKTRFLDSNLNGGTVVFGKDKTEDKTLLMSSKEKKPAKKKGISKKVLIAATLIVVYFMCAKLISVMSSKADIKPKEEPRVSAQKPEVKKETAPDINKDSYVEGLLYKGSPSVTRVLSESNLDDKKKGKGKDKKKDKEDKDDAVIKYTLYNLDPKAVNKKYGDKVEVKIEKIELVNDILVAYLNVENNSDKDIEILHQGNTVLTDSQGRSFKPYDSLSTGISNIPKGEMKKDIKLVFKDFSFDVKYIKLKTSLKIDDSKFTNGNVNLTVNIK